MLSQSALDRCYQEGYNAAVDYAEFELPYSTEEENRAFKQGWDQAQQDEDDDMDDEDIDDEDSDYGDDMDNDYFDEDEDDADQF